MSIALQWESTHCNVCSFSPGFCFFGTTARLDAGLFRILAPLAVSLVHIWAPRLVDWPRISASMRKQDISLSMYLPIDILGHKSNYTKHTLPQLLKRWNVRFNIIALPSGGFAGWVETDGTAPLEGGTKAETEPSQFIFTSDTQHNTQYLHSIPENKNNPTSVSVPSPKANFTAQMNYFKNIYPIYMTNIYLFFSSLPMERPHCRSLDAFGLCCVFVRS